MTTSHSHEGHTKVVNRLKRAGGHLENVISMMESGASCIEVTQQLHAVERAIAAAKKALIHEHVEHCIIDAAGGHNDPQHLLDELKDITKYL